MFSFLSNRRLGPEFLLYFQIIHSGLHGLIEGFICYSLFTFLGIIYTREVPGLENQGETKNDKTQGLRLGVHPCHLNQAWTRRFSIKNGKDHAMRYSE